MKLLGILALSVVVFSASCYMPKVGEYDAVYKLSDYGLPESLEKDKPFYFRYHVSNVAVDIWAEDSLHYTGKVICYTVKHHKNGYQYLGINFKVSDSITNEIVQSFNDYHIGEILAKDNIGFPLSECYDCGTNKFEYHNGRDYFVKDRFSYKDQQTIDSFRSFIEKNIQTDKMFYNFVTHLPYGTYQRNMIRVIKEK